MKVEERVNALLAQGVPMGRSGMDAFAERIAAAIRATENTAIEGSATFIDMLARETKDARIQHALALAAHGVRSLKHPETP